MSRARVVAVVGSVVFASLSFGCGHDEPEDAASSSALNTSPKLGDFVIQAENSVRLDQGGSLIRGGDIGARGVTGPFLSGGAAIDVDPGVWVQLSHNLIAPSIRLDRGTVVGGVQTNRLEGGSRGWHGRVGPFVALPALPSVATATPGSANLTVAAGATMSASPGAFANVSVGNGGKLRLAAGTYDLSNLNLEKGARLEARGAVEIHIANRLATKSNAYVGPAGGVSLSAKNIRIHVSGRNGGNGSLSGSPRAAAFGNDNDVKALVLAPNGTLALGDGTEATGAFMARDVDVGGSGARVTFQDGFTSGGGSPTCSPTSCDDGNPCTVDACSPGGACTHAAAPSGTSCGDGNACNGVEVCNASGSCQAGTPVTCAAPDQCHTAGVCDPSTGVCSNPARPNDSACNDGNACTQTDSCQTGTCVGANSVTCTAADQCHTAGVCNPANGVCSNPVRAEGAACNDANACTQTDSCQAGACVGANPVVCGAPDECHLVGACNSFTGVCSFPPKADGAACSDGNSCTGGDSCQMGMCVPGGATCDAIEVTEVGTGGNASVRMVNTVAASVTSALPGSTVTFTSNVTNTGTGLNIGLEARVRNLGATSFTVRGYTQTMEYLSVATSAWVPFAKLARDATGAPVPDPSLFAMHWGFVSPVTAPGVTYPPTAEPIVGTVIASGATAFWVVNLSPVLPPNIVSVIFDPAQASQIRTVIRFDTTSGPIPAPGAANISPFLVGVTGRIVNPAVQLLFPSDFSGGPLLQTVPGPIESGATSTFSAPLTTPAAAPRGPTETDAAYLDRLVWSTFFGTFLGANVTGDGTTPSTASMTLGLIVPAVSVASSAPSMDGATSTFTLNLGNVGNAPAGPFGISDAVNGMSVPAMISAPATIAPGAFGTATVTIGTPVGAYTNVASVTWQDANGTSYGPVSATYP